MGRPTHDRDDADGVLRVPFTREQLVVRRRYRALSIVNDVLIALWFLIGSVMLLFPAWKEIGTWLFILGSAQFFLRPCIRLAHLIHLRRAPGSEWEM
jgi:hypothetical protein